MTDVSKSVKLAGRLPGSTEHNGMLSVVDELLNAPDHEYMAVIWYDVLTITEDVETGDRVPTARVRRIEPIGETDDASKALREMALRAAADRLGHLPLPFGEDEVSGVRVVDDGQGDD